MTVERIDHGWKDLLKLAGELKKAGMSAKAGFVGPKADEQHSGGLTNLELGIIHEYGAPGANIPARPFISASFTKHRSEYVTALARGMVDVYTGKLKTEVLLGRIGAKMASDMKEYVTQGASIPPPLKPATVAAKGSERALVDTGRMVGSITWEVK